jgi:hypothetical protein
LTVNENNSIFDKKYLTMKIQETFNHAEPMVEPQVKPQVKPNPSEVKPNISPSRRNNYLSLCSIYDVIKNLNGIRIEVIS